MQFLETARARGRELRQSLGAHSRDLLERLRSRLLADHEIELVAVDRRHFLQNGRGEIVPAEGCLYYARDLEHHPEELLEVIAHEYGHLVLHHAGFRPAADDLIRGSVFLDSGAAALSRYSPRSRAEAEASAFAAELICPSHQVFESWRTTPGGALTDLASEYGATPRLVQQQLADGLYAFVVGADETFEIRADDEPTSEQEAAATAIGSPVLVDAGPGTGKTRTLVRRVEFLIRERKVAPENILVLTFSNEAANELQIRIRASLGDDTASRLGATTFHGFGVVVLNSLGHHIGLDTEFSILDETTQDELMVDILGRTDCEALLDIANPSQTATDAVKQINYLKDHLISPLQLMQAIDDWPDHDPDNDARARARALCRLYERYEQIKAERHQVDFADLIALPQRILAEHHHVRQQLRAEFQWVLVDEYQDVSRSTALLLQQLCGDENPPWAVGDARQAIYRFRGAAPENVTQFGADFPGAKRFELADNYRSAHAIIEVVNRLAVLLENPAHQGPPPDRWRAATTTTALGAQPVLIAEAASDEAERLGIVGVVDEWIKSGVDPAHIAVLARRNLDVRNIAIALKESGVRAITSGLLTAEGAGGDLAAVLSAVDLQQALPRVVYALYRERVSAPVLNGVVAHLLAGSVEEEPAAFPGTSDAQLIAAETWRVYQVLRRQVHTDDGLSVLCEFLFFATRYVRDLVESVADPASAVQLDEILSALALATQYRFTHPHVQPRWSRLGLAERLRDLVTQAAPGLVPPRRNVDAVRVMTCHASKGLEFPCVAVAGQSLADVPPPKACLPPQLRPSRDDDVLQAESLLFVGVSRAKRSAVISYATSASGTPRSRRRRFPNLLTSLRDCGAVPLLTWQSGTVGSEDITVPRLWGGEVPSEISMYALAPDTCRVRMYLEEQLGVRFRGRVSPLYRDFIRRVRRMLRRVVTLSVESGARLADNQLDQIFQEEWPAEERADHPHVELYRPRARQWAQMLAQSLDALALHGSTTLEETFQWPDGDGLSRTLKLQLIAQLRDSAGDRIVLALRTKGPGKAALNWSDLNDYQRLPFVLLHERHGDVRPLVFTGSDGRIRPFRWKRGNAAEGISEQVSSARGTFDRLIAGAFDGKVEDWICDRCACRILCPWWLGATS
jgi:DNA helicase II / ATP-dependent DNA helicase PcrA